MSERVQAMKLDKSELPGHGSVSGRRWRWWIAAGVVVVAVVAWKAGLGQFLGGGSLSSADEVDAYTAVLEKPLEIVFDASGYVIAHSTVQINPVVPGTVVELNVEEGGRIKKGEVLARLDDTQYNADLLQAQAVLAGAEAHLKELRLGSRDEDVQKAEAALEQAVARRDLLLREYGRAKVLKNSLSRSEFDKTESSYKEAESTVEQLELSLKLLQIGPRDERIKAAEAEVQKALALVQKSQYFVDCTRIESPVTGTVLECTVDLGEPARPESLTKSMFVLADLRHLEAEVDIPEHELKNVKKGQPCRVTTEAFPGQMYDGRVEWFSPVVNRQRGVRRAKVRILEPDEVLLPDMTCRVQILSGESADAGKQLRVPSEAVVEREGKKFVYLLEDEVARHREVETGETSHDMVEIRKGLQDGDVVLLPESPLRDGQRVRPRIRTKRISA